MIEQLAKPEAVIVQRNGFELPALTDHWVHADDTRNGTPVPGPLLGIGIKLESGHVLYEQMGNIRAATAVEIAALREKQAASELAIEKARTELWAGGGKTVYTA